MEADNKIMEKISELYPQYQRSKDRRQQNIPVAIERRSGNERRSPERVDFDKKLTKDLYDIKNQLAKIEALSPKLFTSRVTTEQPTFSSMNNDTQDRLVKESKPDMSEIERKEAQLQEKASTAFQLGILTAALTAALAVSFTGTIGALIGIGTFIYVGARVFKTLLVKELQDDKKEDE